MNEKLTAIVEVAAIALGVDASAIEARFETRREENVQTLTVLTVHEGGRERFALSAVTPDNVQANLLERGCLADHLLRSLIWTAAGRLRVLHQIATGKAPLAFGATIANGEGVTIPS